MEEVEISQPCSACWPDGEDMRRNLTLCAYYSEVFGDVTFWVWLLMFLLLLCCDAVKVIFSKGGGSC